MKNKQKFSNLSETERLKKLVEMTDEEIDYSDIPETADFTGWVNVGNKSFDTAVKESILKQKIKVNWDEINLILENIRKASQKGRVSLRLDSDIVEYYKNQGRKYQTKINDILRAFMVAEKHAHRH